MSSYVEVGTRQVPVTPIERSILRHFAQRQSWTPTELVKVITSEENVLEDKVRDAIWRLAALGKLKLGPDLTLILPQPK